MRWVLCSIVAAFLIVGIVADFQRVQDTRAVVHTECVDANAIRAEVTKRGRILRRFLVTAAQARAGAARIEYRQGQRRQAELNAHAAKLWRGFAGDVTDLPLRACAHL